MEYTTKETLKTYLGITEVTFDTALTALIKRCTQQFDKYLGRNLESKEYSEYFTVDQEDLVIVSNGPINSIATIRVDNSTGAIVAHTRFDGNIIYLTEEFDGTLYITYNGGYETLAELGDVEQACLEVCMDLWNNTPSSGNEANIRSKQIETLSKSYFSKDDMAGGNGVDFRETLDNYKTFIPVII